MASFGFKPPEELDVYASNKAAEWERFKQRFDVYATATSLVDKDDEVQAATFLHLIGSAAHEVSNTFEFDDEEDRKKLKKLQEKFEAYCVPKKNITMERHSLLTRRQRPGESFDEFITDLRSKARYCDFPASADSLIRDCVVLGINDSQLRERMLREDVDDLEKIIKTCKAAELARTQMSSLQNPRQDQEQPRQLTTLVDRVVACKTSQTQRTTCRYCGGRHPPRQCPAYNRTCNNCGKSNHFASVCQSRKTTSQTNEHSRGQTKEDVHLIDLGTVEISTLSPGRQDKWTENLSVHNKNVLFKLDTGAMASVLPLDEIKGMDPQPSVIPTKVILKGFNNSTSRPVGTVQLRTAYKEKAITANYYVVESVTTAILGQTDCEALGLIERINTVKTKVQIPRGGEEEKQRMVNQYAEVFSGIGEMKQEYDIRTDPSVIPEHQPPRKLPFAKLEKLKATLEDLKQKDIITDEPEHTPWVSNLVATEKKSGELRVCLDPRPLNKAIMRDPFPPPDMEFIHSSLSGKQIFTVID